MTSVFDTNFDAAPPKFTPEQIAALLTGEAVHVNGVGFSLANFKVPGGRLYGPPAAPGANVLAAYMAAPTAWKAAAAEAAKRMGKTAAELEHELGYDVLDEFVRSITR